MEAVSEPDPKFQQLLNKRRWVLWLFNFPILIHSRLRQLIERSSRQDLARQNRNPKNSRKAAKERLAKTIFQKTNDSQGWHCKEKTEQPQMSAKHSVGRK